MAVSPAASRLPVVSRWLRKHPPRRHSRRGRTTALGVTMSARPGTHRATGLGKRGSCHLLSHTCATLMLEGGADIRFIQQLLGHARLDTTQIYPQVSIQQLKQVHSLTHPAKLERKQPGLPDKSRGGKVAS